MSQNPKVLSSATTSAAGLRYRYRGERQQVTEDKSMAATEGEGLERISGDLLHLGRDRGERFDAPACTDWDFGGV